MRMITLDAAKAAEAEIDAIVRELNRQIAEAALVGLSVAVSILTIEKLAASGPTPFLCVEVKVRPDQIIRSTGGEA